MIALFVQVAIFLLVIEATLWCMPSSWRQASQANRLRPNGTRSPNRARLERQAYHRVRLELAAPLMLIFLTGNALYQTVDRTIAPVQTLANSLSPSVLFATTANSPAANPSTGVVVRVATLSLLWLGFSLVVGAWGLRGAFRNFAAGVRERSGEYYQFDVRRSVELTADSKKAKSEAKQGTDVA